MLSQKFQKLLKTNTEAVLISSEVNRLYFTGFPASDGFLVITKNDTVFFTDSRYIEAAENKVKVCRCEQFLSVTDTLEPYFRKNGIKKLYTESDNMTVTMLKRLKKLLPGCTVTADIRVENIIGDLRSIKSEKEIENIVKAQSIAEEAFAYILNFIKPGKTEKEISLALDYYMLSHGAEGLSFETIAVSGKNSSLPHGVPGDKIIEKGDFITIDYGAIYRGYHSDMTRTVIVGKPTAEQKKVYETVLEAQKASLSVIKEGITGFEGDKAARDVIERAGYGKFFGHGTGHGVGVEIHELPNVSPRSQAILKSGNIVTVEPGIYLPGQFGVRIEDMVLVEKNTNRNLTKAPKELIML